MRKFIKDVVRNHNTISTLKKTQGFYLYTYRTLLDIVIYITIFTSLVIISELIKPTETVLGGYLVVLIGSIILAAYMTYSSCRRYSRLTQQYEEIKAEIFYQCHRMLLIVTGTFLILFLSYYQDDISLLLIMFNIILFIIALTIEVLKAYELPEESQNEIFISFALIGYSYLLFTITFNVISNVSLFTEIVIAGLILASIYVLHFIMRIINLNMYILWGVIVLLIFTLVFTNSSSEYEQLIASNYISLTETGCSDMHVEQVLKVADFTYYHYKDENTRDVFRVTDRDCNTINEFVFENGINEWRFMYIYENSVYIYEEHFSPQDQSIGHDKLYSFSNSETTLLYDYDVVFHETIPVIIDGYYTYFVKDNEAYQVIDGEDVPFEDRYNLNEDRVFIDNDNFRVFTKEGEIYYYSITSYKNYYWIFNNLITTYNNDYGRNKLYIDEEGYTLVSFNEKYDFLEKDGYAYRVKDGVIVDSYNLSLTITRSSNVTYYYNYNVKDIVERDKYTILIDDNDAIIIYDEDKNVVFHKVFRSTEEYDRSRDTIIVTDPIGEFLLDNEDNIYIVGDQFVESPLGFDIVQITDANDIITSHSYFPALNYYVLLVFIAYIPNLIFIKK